MEKDIAEKSDGSNWRSIAKVIFTILVVLYPILKVYYISEKLAVVCLADILMVLLLPALILILLKINYIKVNHESIILLCYITIHFLVVNVLILDNAREVFFNSFHYIFVLAILGIFVLNFWDPGVGLKALRITAEISSIFLIAQYIGIYVFGKYISGQIPFLYASTAKTGFIRPFSFFSEPAEFGTYAAIAIAIQLFDKDKQDFRMFTSTILISAAVMLSKSSAGIGSVAVLWFVWFLKTVYECKNKQLKRWFLLLAIGLPCIVFFMYRLDIWEFIYIHVFKSQAQGKLAGGLGNRVSGYSYAFQIHEGNLFQLIFGKGMIELQEFVPGVGRIFIYYGLSGFLIYLFYFISLIKKVDVNYKILILIVMLMSFFSDLIFGLAGLYYLPYVIYNAYQKKRKSIP